MSKEKVKKPFYKKIWVWVVAIIIIFIATSGEGDTETASSNELTETNTEQATDKSNSDEKEKEKEKANEPKMAKMGEPAKVENVTFTVNSAEETKEIDSGNEFVENATTSGKYVILDVTVKNEKDEAITINSSFFKLIADGTEYEPATSGTVMMAMGDSMGDFFLTQINPNLEKTGKVVFEVGAEVDLAKTVLQAQTGAFGTETIKISLTK
ncbi:DUF4352 domain-containing protein [Virgibacillus necropolis]|uniref:DUF4352 domain-containing protein n=1 Tax=Virgibacillus necropolis TaxID=163877 RepID=A0A221MGU3_9BACI|nr:DUF4352 domain-containing protein [Virgibacillus necropolis]ASN06840.1 DUF4352 domain-containing protein [Virgibacillus necropolis]